MEKGGGSDGSSSCCGAGALGRAFISQGSAKSKQARGVPFQRFLLRPPRNSRGGRAEGPSAAVPSSSALGEALRTGVLLSGVLPLCLPHPAAAVRGGGAPGSAGAGGLRARRRRCPPAPGWRQSSSRAAAPAEPRSLRRQPALPADEPKPPGAPLSPGVGAPQPAPAAAARQFRPPERDGACGAAERGEPCEGDASVRAACVPLPERRGPAAAACPWMGPARGGCRGALGRRACGSGYARSELRGGERLRGLSERRAAPRRGCGRLEAFSAGDRAAGTLRKCLRNSNRLVRNLRPSLRALHARWSCWCGGDCSLVC